MINIRRAFRVLSVFLLFPAVAFAAPTPDLYPNQHLKNVGSERARHDIFECRVSAQDYLDRSGRTQSGGGQVVGKAARGAALGALGGTIMGGKAGRGAGAGAAIGGVQGLAGNMREKREGSPEYRKYVDACLEDRGYKVVGWNNR